MPSITVHQHMPCPSADVFGLLHDYSRRLEWDTLLREARLTRGHRRAARGATSLCVGKPLFGIIGVETRYVTFSTGSLAAVEMINRPLFFAAFAASIRHEDVADGSMATYRLRFTAKPSLFRWLLEPLMLGVLRYETRKRLGALARFLRAERDRRRVGGQVQ